MQHVAVVGHANNMDSQYAVPEQTQQTKKKLRLLYFFIGLILVLIIFIVWAGYQIYQQQSNMPRYSPPEGFTEVQGVYGCDPSGKCVLYLPQAAEENCPVTFSSENCNKACRESANLCKI